MSTLRRRIIAEGLREAARAMFEDHNLNVDVRDVHWVCSDSYDIGLVTGAKYLLQRADQLEFGDQETQR